MHSPKGTLKLADLPEGEFLQGSLQWAFRKSNGGRLPGSFCHFWLDNTKAGTVTERVKRPFTMTSRASSESDPEIRGS